MDYKEWRNKIAERSDITGYLIHLTKGREIEDKKLGAIEMLVKILTEKKLNGSTTEIKVQYVFKKAQYIHLARIFIMNKNCLKMES